MDVLVVNCGSSSLKLDVLDAASGARRVRARAERIGAAGASLRIDDDAPEPLAEASPGEVLAMLLPRLLARPGMAVAAVGHRVVHGGERFREPTVVDAEVEAEIERLGALAPLHNPVNLAGIRAARKALPGLLQVAVFDTAFHATLPGRAASYALPAELAAKHGIRRYGFHGTSHAWVAARAAEFLGDELRNLRLVSLHLGNGCSAAAVEYGRCIETSMGMTPLEGLVMGSRSGDLDPGVLPILMRREGLDAEGLDRLLNERSGLLGLAGVADMRDVEARAAEGDEAARLALRVFCHRARKYVGAYAAVLGGLDALVFTGGIGQNSAVVRHRICQRLDFLGARLDEDRNRDARVERAAPVCDVSRPHSRARILVIASDEAHAVARAVAERLGRPHAADAPARIPVAISARHVHLDDAAVESLFGPGHRLTPRQELSQPGQFACEERVTLVGPRRRLEDVSVVGPTREQCQVEISRSDEFHLGVDAPIRCSGDLEGTPGIVLEGPAGRVILERGVICAQRHIHMTPADAERFGVDHKQIVAVALDTPGRDLVFGDVVVRVSPSYALEMHVDTDEGNAAEISRGADGVLAPTGRRGRLRRFPI